MIEDFLQQKLATALQNFIQFERSKFWTAEGVVIENAKIKPLLIDLLSDHISIPLELIEGSIEKIILNKPWEKIFSFTSTPLKIKVDRIHIKTKLKGMMDKSYILRKKDQLIQSIFQKLSRVGEAENQASSLIKRLKEYFASNIMVEVQDFKLEIQMDITRNKISLITQLDSFWVRKDLGKNYQAKSSQIKGCLQGLAISYRIERDELQRKLMSQLTVEFQRDKRYNAEQQSNKHVKVNKIDLHLNNENMRDIFKVLQLIDWHNSFLQIPSSVWTLKPSLRSHSVNQKFRYAVALLKCRVAESKLINIFSQRKQFLASQSQFTLDKVFDAKSYQKVKSEISVWAIASFTRFRMDELQKQRSLQLSKSSLIPVRDKPNIPLVRPETEQLVKQQSKLNGMDWLKSWFRTETNEVQLITELESKIQNSTEPIRGEVKSTLEIKIEEIRINISLFLAAKQNPFLSIVATHLLLISNVGCLPRFALNCMKFKVEYEKYQGNLESYKYLLVESKNMLEKSEFQSEEFEQIELFFELEQENKESSLKILIQPFQVCINQETLEKVGIFNLEGIVGEINGSDFLNTYEESSELEANSPRLSLSNKGKLSSFKKGGQISQSTWLTLSTSIKVIVPSSLTQYSNQEFTAQCNSFLLTLHHNHKKVTLQTKKVTAAFRYPTHHMHSSQGLASNQSHLQYLAELLAPSFIEAELFCFASLDVCYFRSESQLEYKMSMSPISLSVVSCQLMQNLIEFGYLFVNQETKRQKKVVNMMRRKQSIGEEFIDACENLNEHLNRSFISSDRVSKKRLFKEQRNTTFLLHFEHISIQFSPFFDLTLTPITLSLTSLSNQLNQISNHNAPSAITFQLHSLYDFNHWLNSISQKFHKENLKKGINIDRSNAKDPFKQAEKEQILQIELFKLRLSVIVRAAKRKPETQLLQLILDEIEIVQNSTSNCQLHFRTKVSMDYCVEKKAKSSNKPWHKLIEEFDLTYQQSNAYNLSSQKIILGHVVVDLKPELLSTLAHLLSELKTTNVERYALVNNTANLLRIKTKGNSYMEVRPTQKVTLNNLECDFIIFGSKYAVNLMNLHSCDHPYHLQLADFACCSIQEISPSCFSVTSNFTIVNKQKFAIHLTFYQKMVERLHFQKEHSTHSNKKQINLQENIIEESSSKTKQFFDSHANFKQKEVFVKVMLRPQESSSILISSKSCTFVQVCLNQIVFQELKFEDILSGEEIMLESIDDFKRCFLVVRVDLDEKMGRIEVKCELLSPIEVVNGLPWPMSYRFEEDAYDLEEVQENTNKSMIPRKKSFQLSPFQKIESLELDLIQNADFKEVSRLSLQVDQFHHTIVLTKIIQSLVASCQKQDSVLITLQNGPQQIQLRLELSISAKTLRIHLVPELIIINLTTSNVNFLIHEGDYTYPKIYLDRIKSSPLHQLDEVNIQNYLLLNDQQMVETAILKQLFADLAPSTKIFAGRNTMKEKRWISFASGIKPSSLSSSLISDNESDIENCLNAQSSEIAHLSHSSFISYGEEQTMMMARLIKINDLCDLLLFVPTVQVINKSDSNFFAKSTTQKEKLLLITKQRYGFLLVSESGFDLQACEEKEEISLNEWVRVEIRKLQTIYYSKELALNGYESREYSLRKKRMKKAPKVFYKIVVSKYERGFKILIEDSQYPPISFINKTKSKLKVEEQNQHLSQELFQNDMGEYSPKNPYISPNFKIFIAQDYEYLQIAKFQISGGKNVKIFWKNICVRTEEYKSKVIIVIEDKTSQLWQSQASSIQNEAISLEEISTISIRIQSLTLSIMNSANVELAALVVDQLQFSKEHKNYKDYYGLLVSSVICYDYSGVRPQLVFQSSTIHKSSSRKDQLLESEIQEKSEVNDFELRSILNVHKNAITVEKVHWRIEACEVTLSGMFLITLIKCYLQKGLEMKQAVNHFFRNKRPSSSQDFIIEDYYFEETKITIKTLNLEVLEQFVSRPSHLYLIKFISWLKDIKPICLQELVIQFEEYNLPKFISTHLNAVKKIEQLKHHLMDYPIKELKKIFLAYVGDSIGLTKEATPIQKMASTIKILKCFEFLLHYAIQINQNMNQKHFQPPHNLPFHESPLKKIQHSQFIELKYSLIPKKTGQKNGFLVEYEKGKRLERFNSRQNIEVYNEGKSVVKLIIDSLLMNRLHREIELMMKVSQDCLFGLAAGFLIIYEYESQKYLVVGAAELIALECKQKGKILVTYLDERRLTKSESKHHQWVHSEKSVMSWEITGFLKPEEEAQVKHYLAEYNLPY